MQQQAARCEICGEPIFIDADADPRSGPRGLRNMLERAATAHLATHPAPLVQRFLLRKHLRHIEPIARPSAVRQVYAELREIWGDADTSGRYSIDEALGQPTLYRFWMDANRCSAPECRHRA